MHRSARAKAGNRGWDPVSWVLFLLLIVFSVLHSTSRPEGYNAIFREAAYSSDKRKPASKSGVVAQVVIDAGPIPLS